METGNHEKANCDVRLGLRPHCHCCSGGEVRKGYKHSRAVSEKQNRKNMKAKPKRKDHR